MVWRTVSQSRYTRDKIAHFILFCCVIEQLSNVYTQSLTHETIGEMAR